MLGAVLVLLGVGSARAQSVLGLLFPEQRQIEFRDPSQLPKLRVPDLPPPATVPPFERSTLPGTQPTTPRWSEPPMVRPPKPATETRWMSLDDAIRIALANSEVIRVLGGSSGRTIYDPAVANTEVDRARGVFDPAAGVDNNFHHRELPAAEFDPADPTRVLIDGIRTDSYNMAFGLSKTTTTGGTAGLNVGVDRSHRGIDGWPLNPETPSATELSYTQPLLQGGGRQANLAPIEIARIDTERSFFQMKDSVQELLRGVIEAYWALVAARAELRARWKQVLQAEHRFRLANAKFEIRSADIGDKVQAEAALEEFRAGQITAEATVLQREAALRNILGLSPADGTWIVPSTPPSGDRLDIDWDEIIKMAAERRPDLIELRLILEADQQRLLIARNEAMPRLDATALYRWNGLEGRTPDRSYIASGPGQFTGWQLGVNFSVPLGLRQSRAALRREELILMRDRANLEQGLHNASHKLATTYRNLAASYQEYLVFRRSRDAAATNLKYQHSWWESGLKRGGDETPFLSWLQAITQWGNAVSAEARSLTQYNTELADLQRQTGIILEDHGIRFVEERYGSIGPLGRMFADRCYPRSIRPGSNEPQYGSSDKPAEEAFDLEVPEVREEDSPQSNPPAPPSTNLMRFRIPPSVPVPEPRT